jgi:GNAT superfamily N-acetyltransferase
LTIVRARLDDPDAQLLIAQVQAEYVRIYGGADLAPIDATEFLPPDGTFLVGYLGDSPVAMGGWRRHGPEHPETAGSAEIKRMFVTEAGRGRGLARAVLAELERTAQAAGVRRIVLETGYKQPAAIALYRSAGYDDITPFGYYADTPGSVHLAKVLPAMAPAGSAGE